ncbi:MAG: amidohydrolase family protein [Oscillospiraceae bacterium]|nr:amidohydrolase family protein [Oscillospiraceae bacterium]
MFADILLYSKNVFTAKTLEPAPLYVAINDNKITAVGPIEEKDQFIGENTKVYDLGDRVISPGFTDTHSFFTGYTFGLLGADLSKVSNLDEALAEIKKYADENPKKKIVFGQGIDWDQVGGSIPGADALDAVISDRPVIIVNKNRRTAWLNTMALEFYRINPERVFAEGNWRTMNAYLGDDEFIGERFVEYMKLLNSRGITTTMEMGFDEFYGFTNTLKRLEDEDKLSLRVCFMSQAVADLPNVPYGVWAKNNFNSDKLFFDGYNLYYPASHLLNEDGSYPEGMETDPIGVFGEFTYEKLEKWVLEIDRVGIRSTLTAGGDAAVKRILDMYDKCQKDENGRLVNRQGFVFFTSVIDPKDLERMAKLDTPAEVCLQMMAFGSKDRLGMFEERFGAWRMDRYNNYRVMADAGVKIGAQTDLPLFLPDVPQSIYHLSTGRLGKDTEPAFEPTHGLTVGEVLQAWTINNQEGMSVADKVGTLEAGKLADIAVLDGDVFTAPAEEIQNIKVCLTICDGKVVYSTL